MLKNKNEYYVVEKFTKAELFLEEKKVIIFSDYRSMCQFDEDCKKYILYSYWKNYYNYLGQRFFIVLVKTIINISY